MQNNKSSRYKVPNLERALIILEHLVNYPEGLGITELTDALGFSKNSVFRITMTLLENGYLLRDEQKRFSLSRKMLAIGCSALSDQHVISNSLDVMRECRDELHETVLIGTLVEEEGVVMEQVLGAHPFKFSIDLGARLAPHTAAPCKAMLAYMSKPELDSLLSRVELRRFNENTITTKREFRRELQYVRECGYAVDRAEQLHGIHCIGAPVFDQHGCPIAAIWITGPSDRLPIDDFQRFGLRIREYADQISTRLGYGLLGDE